MEEYCKRLEDVMKLCEQYLEGNEDICDMVLSQYLINCERGRK